MHRRIRWTSSTFLPGGGEGTLNTAISAKITAGTLSNTVFRLKPYGLYVLSSTITVPAGKKLTLVAPDPGTTQETAPPMICWTPSSGVTTTFNFDCFGDIYMKNIWLLYATTNTDGVGTQVGSALEIDQDTTDNVNNGVFRECDLRLCAHIERGRGCDGLGSACPTVVRRLLLPELHGHALPVLWKSRVVPVRHSGGILTVSRS